MGWEGHFMQREQHIGGMVDWAKQSVLAQAAEEVTE